MNLETFVLTDPVEMGRLLAERTKALRLFNGWTRDTMAQKAGVTPSSLKRFETTGRASLELVLRVVHALSMLEEFRKLLLPPPARSMDELERLSARPVRKRGRRRAAV